MKNIIIFDVENRQEDYSRIMECIDCLKNPIWVQKNDLNSIFKIVSRENISRCELNYIPAVKYFECPQSIISKSDDKSALIEKSRIPYSFFEEIASEDLSLMSEQKKEDIASRLSALQHIDNNNVCELQLPYTLVAKLKKHKSTTKSYIDSIYSNDVYYHIRVTVDHSRLYDLQYLALFLRHHQDLIDKDRLSVVLLSDNIQTKHFPFCDPSDRNEIQKLDETHRMFSCYLRLLSKQYTGVIYAPKYDINTLEPNLVPMDFKNISSGDRFFPLMQIDNELYEKLFVYKENRELKPDEMELAALIRRNDLWQDSSDTSKKYILFRITNNLRYYNANSENPNDALLAYIAETGWIKLRKVLNTLTEDEQTTIKESIVDKLTTERNNWLTFAIFAFLFAESIDTCNENIHIHDCLSSAYKRSRELSSGLQQLIQNSIQHSKYSSCVLTFFVDDNQNLRIVIFDINTQGTIIDTFKQRLKREVEIFKHDTDIQNSVDSYLVGHNALINNEALKLEHFFNVFSSNNNEESINAWKLFRQSDSTAHIGLLLFYQAVEYCCADFLVQSENNYTLQTENNVFFCSKTNTKIDNADFKKYNSMPNMNSRVIPGTQYSISIPLSNWNNDVPVGGASISKNNYSEDYHTFARFLNSEVIPFRPFKISDFVDCSNDFIITNPDEKFRLQIKWYNFWKFHFDEIAKKYKGNKENIVYWSISEAEQKYFSNNDNCEVFLKGMFAAVNSCQKNNPVYFAITNLDTSFMDMLRNISVSLACKRFNDKFQLYFVDREYESFAQLFGGSFLHAVINSLQLSIEHGSTLYRPVDSANARYISKIIDYSDIEETKIEVVPFDILIPAENNASKMSVFEARMLKNVENRLDGIGASGYKLADTHTRLGSKVHIQSFYEMSFLFYRTTIANRIAFKILQIQSPQLNALIDTKNFLVKPIMFYSYASYSKAILTSLVEITKEYYELVLREANKNDNEPRSEKEINSLIFKAKEQVAFASYQYNLQNESNGDAIQLYFGYSSGYTGASFVDGWSIKKRKSLNISENIDLVLIVPISSTLTTFDKMMDKLSFYIDNSSKGKFVLSNSFTAFWVCDKNEKELEYEAKPSEIEEEYWKSADLLNQIITVKTSGDKGFLHLTDSPYVHYFMRAKTAWHFPLKCSLCFPKEEQLISEVPLVETDLTSTVPSQQIRAEMPPKSMESKRSFDKYRKELHMGIEKNKAYEDGNNKRITMLKQCVFYGHIERGKNHHQYYINTQDFFYKEEVKNSIKEWLEKLKSEHAKDRSTINPKLKIIFSPEHNTNVGFAQYVNTYYFGGTAEVISVNVDKEFRSNFICEHDVLRRTIERLHIQKDIFIDDKPVEFYFADDCVNTGETINKANSFLRSLIPDQYVNTYSPIVFKKCFILIDRLSNASKSIHVQSGKASDYHAFVHIDISHMRRQGDSCVGCKLRNEAKRLFERSASKTMASYWANKYTKLKPTHFDDVDGMLQLQESNYAYERLVLSHIAQNYIFVDGVTTRTRGEYFDSILDLFEEILSITKKTEKTKSKNDNFYFNDLLLDIFKNVSKKHIREINKTGSSQTGDHFKSSKLILCEILLKLMARPFFSYDFSFKIQIQSFLLIVAECYLGITSKDNKKYIISTESLHPSDIETISQIIQDSVSNDRYKAFLCEKDRIKRTVIIAEDIMGLMRNNLPNIVYFFKDVLFESLVDIRSTYLLRKSVISRVNSFVRDNFKLDVECFAKCNHQCIYSAEKCSASNLQDCFWTTYYAYVQKIIDCNADEVKSLWFYYLLLSNNEIDQLSDLENLVINDLSLEYYLNKNELNPYELLLLTAPLEYDLINESFQKEETSLNNYYLQRKWSGVKSSSSSNTAAKEWLSFLRGDISDENNNDNNAIISNRYSMFKDKLSAMLNELHSNDATFRVAVLTADNNGHKKTSDRDNIKLEGIHILSDNLHNFDKRTEVNRQKYILKKCIIEAWDETNSKSLNLAIRGYYIKPNAVDSDNSSETLCGNFDDSYIIIYFDNPSDSNFDISIGRKQSPLSKVFLYIGISYNNQSMQKILPLVVLREVLSYRNLIMRMLEEDFDSELMQKHAKSIQEEAVITHEKSASHASTTDERGVLQVFGVGDVSELNKITHPIDIQTKKLLDGTKRTLDSYCSAELWLLLQNYVNGQIARLFNRIFSLNENDLENEGIPRLYLGANHIMNSDEFKKPFRKFSDLNIQNDNRFDLLRKAIHMEVQIDDSNIFSPIVDNDHRYYNLEFVRCIIFDILFSAIKYATTDHALLPRINNLYMFYDSDSVASLHSYVFMFRDNQYLVILNNANIRRVNMDCCRELNEDIHRRTHDLLDYGDGHMSLFTIRKFILGLYDLNKDNKNEKNKYDTEFKYLYEREELIETFNKIPGIYDKYKKCIEKEPLWFQTKLPIFYTEDNDGHCNMD